jgi:16S rRNA (guanine1207-N2)-methyltransferase
VLRAVPSGFLDLVPPERLTCVQTFRPVHDALAAEGRRVATRAEGTVASAVVNVTRSRAESLGNVALGLGLLAPGGRLVVTGARTDGVDAVAKAVAAALPVAGSFVKAHGRVVWLDRPERLPGTVEGWARAAAPAANAEGFVTAPGMFSPEHADPGSRRLAEAIDGRLAGRVADLGAGWGWLARAALERNPAIAALDLHEAELLALEAARANVTDPRARFHWSDVARLGKGAGPCDAVIMNPPFHQGRAAEPEIGTGFIAAAARMLAPQGRLTLVANRQMPYEAALEAGFRRWTKLAEEGGYKLLEAEGPRRG